MHTAQFTITGRLTKDADIRQGATGDFAILNVATERTFRNANGQQDKKTFFHSLICFKSNLINYLSCFKKGNLVHLVGEIVPTESTDANGNRSFDNKLEISDAKNFGGGNSNGQNYNYQNNGNNYQNNGNNQNRQQNNGNGYQNNGNNQNRQQNNGNGYQNNGNNQNRQQNNGNGYQNRQQNNGNGYQNNGNNQNRQQNNGNGYQNNGNGYQGNQNHHDDMNFDDMQPQGDYNPYPDNV